MQNKNSVKGVTCIPATKNGNPATKNGNPANESIPQFDEGAASEKDETSLSGLIQSHSAEIIPQQQGDRDVPLLISHYGNH